MTTPQPMLMKSVDVAVIGSGIAGLFLAVKCAKAGLKVAVITKKEISTSSTNWAQGGIAGVLDTENKEALEMHIQDKLICTGFNGGNAVQGLVDATSANSDIVFDPILLACLLYTSPSPRD